MFHCGYFMANTTLFADMLACLCHYSCKKKGGVCWCSQPPPNQPPMVCFPAIWREITGNESVYNECAFCITFSNPDPRISRYFLAIQMCAVKRGLIVLPLIVSNPQLSRALHIVHGGMRRVGGHAGWLEACAELCPRYY